jgi:hypothetical protein
MAILPFDQLRFTFDVDSEKAMFFGIYFSWLSMKNNQFSKAAI